MKKPISTQLIDEDKLQHNYSAIPVTLTNKNTDR